MKIFRILFLPITIIYGAITILRNGFYRVGIFKSSKFSIPVISVGNLSMGGTGKTPHTEYLIHLLKNRYTLFTLSRGFGRKERGFIIAYENSTSRQIGDEPLQYYKKFGKEIGVAVEANRVMGVMDICRIHPETQLVLLDDAYQHRAIYSGLSILITTYAEPFYTDFLLPVGNLRELRHGKNRANVIIVSKCPALNDSEKQVIISKIKPTKEQTVFFSRMKYGQVESLTLGTEAPILENKNLVVVTGIADATPLIAHLSKNNKILHHFNFNDHHNFKEADLIEIHNLFDKFAPENPLIITTEKDAMRLMDDSFKNRIKNYPWFYQSIEVEIDNCEKLNQIVNEYVEKNS
jgi:tetraacyldisaccharide 4'-kinase